MDRSRGVKLRHESDAPPTPPHKMAPRAATPGQLHAFHAKRPSSLSNSTCKTAGIQLVMGTCTVSRLTDNHGPEPVHVKASLFTASRWRASAALCLFEASRLRACQGACQCSIQQTVRTLSFRPPITTALPRTPAPTQHSGLACASSSGHRCRGRHHRARCAAGEDRCRLFQRWANCPHRAPNASATAATSS